MKILLIILITIAICKADFEFPKPPGDQCVSSMPAIGLGNIVEEIIDILPYKDIAFILQHAIILDTEVRELFRFFRSDTFNTVLITLYNIPEFIEFMEDLCEDLYIDSYFYLNLIPKLFGSEQMQRPKYRNFQDMIASQRRPGFKGLLEDIGDIMPTDELLAKFLEHLNNEYLNLAREKIASSEFKRVLNILNNTSELEITLQKIRDTGVDIDSFFETLGEILNIQ